MIAEDKMGTFFKMNDKNHSVVNVNMICDFSLSKKDCINIYFLGQQGLNYQYADEQVATKAYKELLRLVGLE